MAGCMRARRKQAHGSQSERKRVVVISCALAVSFCWRLRFSVGMRWQLFRSLACLCLLYSVTAEPIYPVENACLAILDRLSDTASMFLNCAVSRARPFKLCEGCVDSYARFHDLVNLLDRVCTAVSMRQETRHLPRYRPIQMWLTR
jgi:hypothetical protein